MSLIYPTSLTLCNAGSWWNSPRKLWPLELVLSLKSLEASQSGSQKGAGNVVKGKDNWES